MNSPRSAGLAPTEAELRDLATRVLTLSAASHTRLASAESCTGGLVSSLLTDVEGCSGAFERGFVTYSEEAKIEMLGVSPVLLANQGAVSPHVATAMAEGALRFSRADVAVSITGYAGKADDGGEPGLAFIAVATRKGDRLIRECHFGARDRDANRRLAASAACDMLVSVLA